MLGVSPWPPWQALARASRGYAPGEAQLIEQVRQSVAAHGATGVVDLSMLKEQKLG
ncbi:MAG TPA: hypothetical protein VFE79_07515 [Paraburkholderia sp.]|jgi:hypothetical protein|nr:hypothetical protein [Paraburkholderia sp.]